MDSKLQSPLEIAIKRPAFNQDGLDESYAYQRTKSKGCGHATKKILAHEFSCARLKKGLKARVPFIDTIRNYSKNYVIGDVVAGLTAGIMQIPLGMAYAIMGSCPPETGLYTSFFPVLIYFFLGTSRHISQGTFAITSLMFAKAVQKYSTPVMAVAHNETLFSNLTTLNETMGSMAPMAAEQYSSIQVASTIALIAGVVQLIMGFLRFGYLSMYMSDTLISGFTAGAALLVFTSQFGALFDIKVPKAEWAPETLYTYYYVFTHIAKANVTSVILSIVSIIVLAFTGEVLNPILQPKIKVPIPIDLLLVVIGTGVSYAMELQPNYNVSIVGEIPLGLPFPTVPPVKGLFTNVLADSIAIGIVTYIISLSLAKIFAKKHNYDINANQEFIAMGVANFVSSFFSCFPMCVALSRSMVVDSVGGKTQLSGLISCGVVLVVLLAIAKMFKCLPSCILAAIIVVAIRRAFLQFRVLKATWKISKLEALTWIATFLAVSFIAIDKGLGIGVVVAILTIVFRSQSPSVSVLGWVNETDMYLDVKKYSKAQEEKGIKIYQYGGPILFANSKSFRKTLYEITGVNPRILGTKLDKMKKRGPQKTFDKLEKQGKLNTMVDMTTANNTSFFNNTDDKSLILKPQALQNLSGVANMSFETDDVGATKYVRKLSIDRPCIVIDELNEKNANNFGSTDIICNTDKIGESAISAEVDIGERDNRMIRTILDTMKQGLRHIVIDGSAISFVDFAGVAAFAQIVEEYEKIEVTVLFAALKEQVRDMMESNDFYEKFPRGIVYPTIRDAVLHALDRNKKDVKLGGPSSSTKL